MLDDFARWTKSPKWSDQCVAEPTNHFTLGERDLGDDNFDMKGKDGWVEVYVIDDSVAGIEHCETNKMGLDQHTVE